jgi:hypothetical protein
MKVNIVKTFDAMNEAQRHTVQALVTALEPAEIHYGRSAAGIEHESDALIACPAGRTGATIRAARASGKFVYLCFPDGSLIIEYPEHNPA